MKRDSINRKVEGKRKKNGGALKEKLKIRRERKSSEYGNQSARGLSVKKEKKV